jgi:hypothetical protein
MKMHQGLLMACLAMCVAVVPTLDARAGDTGVTLYAGGVAVEPNGPIVACPEGTLLGSEGCEAMAPVPDKGACLDPDAKEPTTCAKCSLKVNCETCCDNVHHNNGPAKTVCLREADCSSKTKTAPTGIAEMTEGL